MSFWEPVLLVDSRIPYGADIGKQRAITQTAADSSITGLHTQHAYSDCIGLFRVN